MEKMVMTQKTTVPNYKNCIETFTGKLVNPFDFSKEDVDILDIAVALSHVNRYGGHTNKPYSVAEHSIILSYATENLEHAWYGQAPIQSLLHDASEAYTGDIPKPIKNYFVGLEEAEHNITKLVFDKYNVFYQGAGLRDAGDENPLLPVVKEYDTYIVYYESKKYKLKKNRAICWDKYQPESKDAQENILEAIQKTTKLIKKNKGNVALTFLVRFDELRPGIVTTKQLFEVAKVE